MLFPLRKRPTVSYKTGHRFFGAARAQGRKHAGCDLLAKVGTEILAVEDGIVLRGPYYFYDGTYALEVRHGTGFIVRYGEIGGTPAGISPGKPVRKGQVIAYVGMLEKYGHSMLHFEMYSGTGTGPLTVRSNKPFQRRNDLIDPTQMLDTAITGGTVSGTLIDWLIRPTSTSYA
jgi:murein DD-endopeptidase MepM/ murein hydrolase activator NlpD